MCGLRTVPLADLDPQHISDPPIRIADEKLRTRTDVDSNPLNGIFVTKYFENYE